MKHRKFRHYNHKNNDQTKKAAAQLPPGETKLSIFCLEALETLWLVALFGIPLLIIPDILPTTLKFYVFGIIELIMLFFWLVRMFEIKKFELKFNFLTILLSLLLLSIIISTIFSLAPDLSFWGSERRQGLVSFFLYFLFFVMVASSIKKREHVENIFSALIFVGFVNSIIAILQYYNMNFFGNSPEMLMDNGRYRAYGMSGNPIFLAGWFVMVIPLTCYRIYEEWLKKKWQNVWLYCYIIIFILQTIALMLTFTRGAIVAFAFSMFVGLVLAGVIKKIRWLWISAIIVFVVITASVISINTKSNPLGIPKDNAVTMRFSNILSKGGSFYSRTQLWKMLLKPIKEHILIGVGPDAFGSFSYSKEYFDVELMKLEVSSFQKRLDRAHNIVLDSLLSTGVFGTIFLMGIFIYIIVILFKNIIKNKKESDRFLALALFVVIIGYIVQALTSFSEVMMYSLLFIFFAIIYYLQQNKFEPIEEIAYNKKSLPDKKHSIWLYLIIVVPLGMIFYFIITPPFMAEMNYKNAVKMIKDTQTNLAGQELLISNWQKNPRQDKSNTAVLGLITNSNNEDKIKWFEAELFKMKQRMPEELFYPFMLAETYHKWGELKNDPSKFEDAKNILDEAIDHFGNKYQLYGTYIFILADLCDFEGADAKIAEALDFSVYLKGQYYLMATKGALGCGNTDEAIEYLEEIKGVSDVVSYPDKFDQLGKIYVEKGNVGKAVENWKQCLEVIPNDANCLGNLAIYYANNDAYGLALEYAEKLKKSDKKRGETLIQKISALKAEHDSKTAK